MKIYLYILSLFSICLSLHGNENNLKQVNLTKVALVHRTLEVNYETAQYFTSQNLPLLAQKDRPAQLSHEGYIDHKIYDIRPLVNTPGNYEFNDNEWIAYNATTQTLHIHLNEKLAEFIKPIFLPIELSIPQTHIQARFYSVKRQKDPFADWNRELIEKANPKELLSINLNARSGEKCTISSVQNDNKSYNFEVEPLISEDERLTYLRFYASFQSQHNLNEINTGLIVAANTDFIQPIGISSDPDHLTVMVLRVDVVNHKGELIEVPR